MLHDEIIVLPSGTEISVDAALGDLDRAIERVGALGLDDLASDLDHVQELVRVLAGRVP